MNNNNTRLVSNNYQSNFMPLIQANKIERILEQVEESPRNNTGGSNELPKISSIRNINKSLP